MLSGYSRLVIDCNRPLRSAESIAKESAGVPVPRNRGLSPAERESRINALFRPYHDAIDELLNGRSRRRSLLLSIHSFTPLLNGRPRPWHIVTGIGDRPRFSQCLISKGIEFIKRGLSPNYPYYWRLSTILYRACPLLSRAIASFTCSKLNCSVTGLIW